MRILTLKLKLKYYFFALLLLFFGLRLCANHPDSVEKYYTRGFYSTYSAILQYLTSSISFSIGDLLYGLILLYLFTRLIRLLLTKDSWKRKLKNFVVFSLKTIVVFLCYFNLSWGLNNYRQPLNQQLNIEGTYTQEEIIALTKKIIKATNAQLIAITNDSLKAVVLDQTNQEIFEDVNVGLHRVGQQTTLFDYKPHKVKSSLFSLPLTYMGFSGYLNPFTLESQVNTMIPTTTMIVTASHEVIHQLGYALESDANFLGFLAAAKQDQLVYQYGANIYALRYCLNAIDYNENEPMMLQNLLQSIHPGVQVNIIENMEFWQEYKTITDSFFKVFYGAFLKANNQKDGIRSYNRFVDLLVNYDSKTGLYN